MVVPYPKTQVRMRCEIAMKLNQTVFFSKFSNQNHPGILEKHSIPFLQIYIADSMESALPCLRKTTPDCYYSMSWFVISLSTSMIQRNMNELPH